MIKLDRVVIVEGKYDKIKLSSVLEATIITTDGFAVFKDKEKMDMIRLLAKKKGLLVLTDSDSAGFKIRSYIRGCIPKEQVVHAYIPDLFGKEKRKTEASKEGKLGVEGVPMQVILDALNRAGVQCSDVAQPERRITKTDLFEDGLSGTPDSRANRLAFLKLLELPERMPPNSLLEVLNSMMSYEEYKQTVETWQKQQTEQKERTVTQCE